MKVITDVSFYKLIQGLQDGEDYIEDSEDLYGDHFKTVNGMIDYVVEYAFGDLYSDRYKTGITKMANDPRYSNCIDIRSGEDAEIGDDGMKHVEVDISSCSGDRIEMVPFSSELSKYTWSVSIAYSVDEVEGAEDVHESRSLRGRMLKESFGFDWEHGNFELADLVKYVKGCTGARFRKTLDYSNPNDPTNYLDQQYSCNLNGYNITIGRHEDCNESTLDLYIDGELESSIDPTADEDAIPDANKERDRFLKHVVDVIEELV